MISEIRYNSRAAGIDATVTEVAIFNVGMILVFALIWYFKLVSDPSPCLILVLTVVILNALLLISARRSGRFFDTLQFSVRLPEGSLGERDRLQAIILGAERYLAANRISYAAAKADGPYIGRIWAPAQGFQLEGMGLRLEIFWNVPGGSSISGAKLCLGPVPDGNDPVARKLLEGLRQELLRSEERAPPGKSG